MKIQVVCGKCGKTFEAEESVRTDVCPHCMSFVELRGTGAASAEKLTGNGQLKTPGAGSPIRPLQKGTGSAAPASPGDTYAAAYAEAERMMAAGAWSNAARLFVKCLAEKEDGWQARFGLVRAKTREFTDLSALAGVQEDAAVALRAMPREERRAFGVRYLPVLTEKRRALARSLNALNSADVPAQSGNDLLDAAGENMGITAGGKGGKKSTPAVILCFCIAGILFVIGGAVMSASVAAGGAVFAAGALAGVAGIALGIRSEVRKKRADAAQRAVAEVKEESRRAEKKELQAQLDAIDLFCGYLKN